MIDRRNDQDDRGSKGTGRLARVAVTTAVAVGCSVGVAIPALADTQGGTGAESCPLEGDQYVYSFTNVSTSSRPTNLYSAYITGPGTITYSKSTTANVSASMTASVSAEAGVVFAKASSSIGVGVSAGRSWSDGFSYSLQVPSGQTRRMRLFQESRNMTVTKKSWDGPNCRYNVVYSSAANAPRTTRVDAWRLEA